MGRVAYSRDSGMPTMLWEQVSNKNAWMALPWQGIVCN